jgi:hypothetical protein
MSILERLAAITASKKSAPARTKPVPEKTWDNEALDWSKTPLSKLQKARIAQLAAHAYKAQKYLDQPLEEWRRSEQEIACGRSSLRECTQAHFLSLVAHFQALAGDTAESKKTWSRTGRVKGSPILHDTHENRKTAIEKITEVLDEHKARREAHGNTPSITWPYVLAIVKNQHKKPIDQLTAAQLQRLLFTVTNRINAKEGRGHSRDRNKSQRRRK